MTEHGKWTKYDNTVLLLQSALTPNCTAGSTSHTNAITTGCTTEQKLFIHAMQYCNTCSYFILSFLSTTSTNLVCVNHTITMQNNSFPLKTKKYIYNMLNMMIAWLRIQDLSWLLRHFWMVIQFLFFLIIWQSIYYIAIWCEESRERNLYQSFPFPTSSLYLHLLEGFYIKAHVCERLDQRSKNKRDQEKARLTERVGKQ